MSKVKVTFFDFVRHETHRSKLKFPEPTSVPLGWSKMQLAHFWYSVINEELEEYKAEVHLQQFDVLRASKELVQVASTCQRAMESLGECDVEEDNIT